MTTVVNPLNQTPSEPRKTFNLEVIQVQMGSSLCTVHLNTFFKQTIDHNCFQFICRCQYNLYVYVNTIYTSMSIQSIHQCQYNLYVYVNTIYTSILMSIQSIRLCQYNLYVYADVNTIYTCMSIQSIRVCQHNLYVYVNTFYTSMSIQSIRLY